MNYERLKPWLVNRRWTKWCSYVYLQRYRGSIRIRFGYRFRHSKVMAVWYPDGRFKFEACHYYPSMLQKMNRLLPDDYHLCSHRYYSFLYRTDKNPALTTEPMAIHIRNEDRGKPDYWGNHQPDLSWIWINKTGIKPELTGPTLAEVTAKLRNDDDKRDLPRRRGRYWLRKARGIYRNRCGKHYPDTCNWRLTWPKPTTEWKGDCGCHVYTKKAISHDTVASILAEKNATVRTAKIQIYGVERFFIDAKAKTINKEAGYELLELDTGQADRPEDNRRFGRPATANLVLAALRMECSTTGKVYVNTVPNELRTVGAALDWMYNTTNYLERVGMQT